MSLEADMEEIVRRVVREELERVKVAVAQAPTAATSVAEVLSLPSAAKYLGVGRSTLRQYAEDKLLPYTKPNGTRYKFKKTDLDAFAAKHQGAAARAVVDPDRFEEQSKKNVRRALGGGDE